MSRRKAIRGAEVRFVVLHHEGIPDPHFDLMIEAPGKKYLYTWRCKHDPLGTYISFPRRIQNHRRDYLTYEGPVSSNRGYVSRVRCGVGDFWKTSRRMWALRYDRAGDGRYRGYLLAPAGHKLWHFEGWDGPAWIDDELPDGIDPLSA
jgi:hypothetical protein